MYFTDTFIRVGLFSSSLKYAVTSCFRYTPTSGNRLLPLASVDPYLARLSQSQTSASSPGSEMPSEVTTTQWRWRSRQRRMYGRMPYSSS